MDAPGHYGTKKVITYLEELGKSKTFIRRIESGLDHAENFEDTEKKGETLKQKYSISSSFTPEQPEQLKKLLTTENVIREGELILISSHNNRDKVLIKENGVYYYFDPNSKKETRATAGDDVEMEQLISEMIGTTNSAIGFRMFSSSDTDAIKRPPQEEVLAELATDDPASALMMAVKIGCLGSTNYLLENGANPDAQDPDDSTALMVAAGRGYPDIVERLLQADANVNLKNKDGWNALLIAARNKHNDIVKKLYAVKGESTTDDTLQDLLSAETKSKSRLTTVAWVSVGIGVLAIAAGPVIVGVGLFIATSVATIAGITALISFGKTSSPSKKIASLKEIKSTIDNVANETSKEDDDLPKSPTTHEDIREALGKPAYMDKPVAMDYIRANLDLEGTNITMDDLSEHLPLTIPTTSEPDITPPEPIANKNVDSDDVVIRPGAD